jgi:hypothetical protein
MRTRAMFRLFGDGGSLSAANVTTKLGIEPTWAAEAGARVGRQSQTVRAASLWTLSTGEDIQGGAELANRLDCLLSSAVAPEHSHCR